MRRLRFLAPAVAAAALIACGDNGDTNRPIDGSVVDTSTIDAAVDAAAIDAATDAAAIDAAIDAANIDAPVIDAPAIDAGVDAADIDAPVIDAAVDAPIDAPIDAPPPLLTTVWAFGDVATNNLGQLGRFAHPATAPVTPTFVPAAGELPSANFPVPFSVALDNSKVAYIARATATDPWKVSIANSDGTGTIDVFTAATATVVISDIALSPDKTKIAFRADLELTGMFDVYVVSAAAAQTPVKVSPDRGTPNAALDAQTFLVWSADSRFLAFGGEYTEDLVNEVVVRDTMTNTTTAVVPRSAILGTTGTRGLVVAPQWNAANKLFVLARINAAAESQLYTTSVSGTDLAILPNTVLSRPDATTSQVNNYALSPDGATLVFSADGLVATGFELYSMPSTGAAAATRLTAGTVAAGRNVDINRPIRFNPAGTAIAFGADFGATNDKIQPYVLTLAGTLRRLAIIGLDTDAARDIQAVAWTHDGAFLYVVGDDRVDNDFEVYALDTAMADQAVTVLVDPPASGDVFEIVTRFAP